MIKGGYTHFYTLLHILVIVRLHWFRKHSGVRTTIFSVVTRRLYEREKN